MIILNNISSMDKSIDPSIVLLFGNGLIGSQIVKHLVSVYGFILQEEPYDWAINENSIIFQITNISDIVKKLLLSNFDDKKPRVSIIWAAGKAGFSSPEDVIKTELQQYEKFLTNIENLFCNVNVSEIRFYLISSAGALFEGQKCISLDSVIKPLRPYGWLKYEEEQLLHRSAFKNIFIYRPSSVYGPIVSTHRRGLISAMITSTFQKHVCKVYGGINTLRDYVYSSDIGRFLSKEILSNQPQATYRNLILASCRPSSIFEIKNEIERILNKKMYFSLSPNPSNSLDITYSLDCVPNENWGCYKFTG